MSATARTTGTYDVLVYGATAGGAMAAIAAAAEGVTVGLLEPGHHLGGMVSGGLGYSDLGNRGGSAGTSSATRAAGRTSSKSARRGG